MNTSSDILTESAKRDAETESEFGAANDVARKANLEGPSFRLDKADSQRFVEALLASPDKPTPRFSQALNTYQKSVVER
ncbi:MAG: DUF1778 domain-containing protein [Luteolibacter sp.]|uniref:type II toxin -antitoxin system TacA 1-like antitoxin n=1 Tax=Luteolibacter sp. TaxID=1962973 RepID=UPI00326616E7